MDVSSAHIDALYFPNSRVINRQYLFNEQLWTQLVDHWIDS